MRIIRKYPLNPKQETPPFVMQIAVPLDSVALHVAMQEGYIMIWFQEELEVPTIQQRHIIVIPTGAPIPPEYSYSEYIGTVQDGQHEWHVLDATYAYEKKQNQ